MSVRLGRLHAGVAIGVAGAYAVFFAVGSQVSWFWIALWSASCLLIAKTPSRPELGLAAYVVTLYATPRYSELFDALVRSWLLDVEVLLIIFGAGLWSYRNGDHLRLKNPLVLLAFTFFAWGCVCAIVPRPESPDVVPRLAHSLGFFLHALALLVVASRVMSDPSSAQAFVMPLCAGVLARALWQGTAGLDGEGDIGPIVAMVLPLVLTLARTASYLSVRSAALFAFAGGLLIVALTYNRGSAVALVVVLCALAWRSRREPWVLATVGLSVVASAYWLLNSPYLRRFQQASRELAGQAVGSVSERLELWAAGFEMAQRNPIFGVGPGQYAAELANFSAHHGMVAHNSLVQVAAEMGFPGLTLYLALFLCAIASAQQQVRQGMTRPLGLTAGALQISLLAYLAAGLFISRHDMVLGYLMVGWIAALSLPPANATPTHLGPQASADQATVSA